MAAIGLIAVMGWNLGVDLLYDAVSLRVLPRRFWTGIGVVAGPITILMGFAFLVWKFFRRGRYFAVFFVGIATLAICWAFFILVMALGIGTRYLRVTSHFS